MAPIRALNQMAAPRLGTEAFLHLAARLGCAGVELRGDLGRPLLDGLAPARVRDMAEGLGLRVLALAELSAFDDWDGAKRAEAERLGDVAAALGADPVLIPRCDGAMTGPERRERLRAALAGLAPVLEARGLRGLIEPLGFARAALRLKSEAAEAIAEVGGPDGGPFGLVHDTFHHHLAGEAALFAALTGIVHVSGVDAALAPGAMADAHRGLVGPGDRLGTLAQLRALAAAGWAGPVSMEPFAPSVHADPDPEAALRASFAHIESRLAPVTA